MYNTTVIEVMNDKVECFKDACTILLLKNEVVNNGNLYTKSIEVTYKNPNDLYLLGSVFFLYQSKNK